MSSFTLLLPPFLLFHESGNICETAACTAETTSAFVPALASPPGRWYCLRTSGWSPTNRFIASVFLGRWWSRSGRSGA